VVVAWRVGEAELAGRAIGVATRGARLRACHGGLLKGRATVEGLGGIIRVGHRLAIRPARRKRETRLPEWAVDRRPTGFGAVIGRLVERSPAKGSIPWHAGVAVVPVARREREAA